MFGMWIKKWSRIRGIARHKVSMVLPISLLFKQNPPVPSSTRSKQIYIQILHSNESNKSHSAVTPSFVSQIHCCVIFVSLALSTGH